MNSRKVIIALSIVLLILGGVAIFAFVIEERVAPLPVPDLTGEWVQAGAEGSADWYFVADITDDVIEIWWYLPSEDERALYWSGTFTPPPEGQTGTYTWTSVNDIAKAKTCMRLARGDEALHL
jgi:hypothetical protein